MRFTKLCAIITAIGTIGSAPLLHGQELSRPAVPSLVELENNTHVDMLSVGGNPAWLYERTQLPPMTIRLSQQSSNGDERTAFDPARSTRYQYSVEGQKELSADHVVSGTFGVVQEYRGDWMWSDTKFYDTGSPLLMADSSTGTTDYRGLLLNGTYSGSLGERWLVGATMRYGVDNGVKRVSPKPLDMQRAFGLELGSAYRLSPAFSLGASVMMKNEKEENDFDADQTAVQSQTILFKFRGFDTFQELTKSSENRIVLTETYGGFLQGTYAADGVSSALSVGSLVRSSDITDGGSSPISQGYWQSQGWQGQWSGTYVRDDSLALCANARITIDHQWTRHPDFDVRLTEQHLNSAEGGVLVRVPVLHGPSVFAGCEIAWKKHQIDDYISQLTADLRSFSYQLSVGASWRMSHGKSIRLWYAWESQRPDRDIVTVTHPSTLYASVGARNFAYETASVGVSTIGIDAGFNGGIFGQCAVTILGRFGHVRQWDLGDTPSRTSIDVSLSTML